MSLEGLLASAAEAAPRDETFTTRGRTITESDIVSFAALTGDWHPQHADASWAATGRFGQRVAHGMLLISYAVGLVEFDPERVVALRGLDGVVFKRPVTIGDTIHVEGRVDGTRELDDETALMEMSWKIVNQRSATVARAKVTAVCRREPVLGLRTGTEAARLGGGGLFDEVFL